MAAPPRKQTAKEWVQSVCRRIDHELVMNRIENQGAKIMATHKALRRATERLTQRHQDHAWLCAKAEAAIRGTGLPVATARERFRQVCARSGIVPPGQERDVPTFIAHVEALCRRHAITVTHEALPATNAYAQPTLRLIELPRILSLDDYIGSLHEIGHVLRPCAPPHQRVPRRGRPGTVCVACERAAWDYAAAEALTWPRAAHEGASRSLRSYLVYATPAEADAIAAWCNSWPGLAMRRALAGPSVPENTDVA